MDPIEEMEAAAADPNVCPNCHTSYVNGACAGCRGHQVRLSTALNAALQFSAAVIELIRGLDPLAQQMILDLREVARTYEESR